MHRLTSRRSEELNGRRSSPPAPARLCDSPVVAPSASRCAAWGGAKRSATLTAVLVVLAVFFWAPTVAAAHTVPGTSAAHVLGIKNTPRTPALQARINNYIRTHSGVDRWRTIFEHYRDWQIRCRAAGKGNGHVWEWSWGRAIMARESGGLWNAYNPAWPYCAGPWQLAFCHRAKMGWTLVESVYVWNQWYLAARLYRDSGAGPWAL